MPSMTSSATTTALDFPEVPLRAYRIVKPYWEVYERLNAAARMRFDIEVLLRRAGLLACERNYASHTALAVVVANKANVKRATLRAAVPAADRGQDLEGVWSGGVQACEACRANCQPPQALIFKQKKSLCRNH
jgi:hypothetical protein